VVDSGRDGEAAARLREAVAALGFPDAKLIAGR